jgi:hypothetical protein
MFNYSKVHNVVSVVTVVKQWDLLHKYDFKCHWLQWLQNLTLDGARLTDAGFASTFLKWL